MQDVSVMCATLCAVEAVATRRPQEFKHLVPSLISILKQVSCEPVLFLGLLATHHACLSIRELADQQHLAVARQAEPGDEAANCCDEHQRDMHSAQARRMPDAVRRMLYQRLLGPAVDAAWSAGGRAQAPKSL